MKGIVNAVKSILTGKGSAIVDEYCINKLKIPSITLMERAAFAAYEEILKDANGKKVCVIAGTGNNGGDGIAIGRMLYQSEIDVTIFIIGNMDKSTEEFKIQYNIVENIGIKLCDIDDFKCFEYDMIIDSIFGIGLSRNISGKYAEVINEINDSDCEVISIDVPSGLCSERGIALGCAVKADNTITFGHLKSGLLLCDGKKYSGNIIIKDIGFDKLAYIYLKSEYYDNIYMCLEQDDINMIPLRNKVSNKGTYGRIVIIAGSKEMFGAAYLSAVSAYRCGAGIVEIYTHTDNLKIMRMKLPEAIVHDYDSLSDLDENSLVVIGPGLGTNELSKELVKKVLESKAKSVIDADGINTISKNTELLKLFHKNVIITPHIKEMSRLTNISCSEIRENIVNTAKIFAKTYKCVVVLKDATSVIANSHGDIMINLSGNSGMSTGGSGDVLTGIIAGMLSQNLPIYEAAYLGVYLHGLSGDRAKEKMSSYGMIASDIVESIPEILKLR